MTRGDLIVKILDDIVSRVNAIIPLDADWVNRYNADKLMSEQKAVQCCSTIMQEPYRKIISFIERYVNSEEYTGEETLTPIPVYTLEVPEDSSRRKKFWNLQTASDPYVATLDVFGEVSHINIEGGNWKVWERIWTVIADDAQEKNKFWDDLLRTNRLAIYINTNEPNVSDDVKWKMYSYAYLACVNESSFPLPVDIEKSSSSVLYPGLIYNSNAKYDQFFDVYDVLNEVKYAPDLLTEFVKIYQVLELLTYRYKFQTLIASHMRNHYPIVRQIESMTEKFKKGELDELENFFKDILVGIENRLDPTDASGGYPTVPDYLKTDIVDYLKLNYSINTGGSRPVYSNRNIADIVYKIRCGIVHNKETEFHLTYNNIEEYRVVVPLIKKLNELLLMEIMELINDGNRLLYLNKNLVLY